MSQAFKVYWALPMTLLWSLKGSFNTVYMRQQCVYMNFSGAVPSFPHILCHFSHNTNVDQLENTNCHPPPQKNACQQYNCGTDVSLLLLSCSSSFNAVTPVRTTRAFSAFSALELWNDNSDMRVCVLSVCVRMCRRQFLFCGFHKSSTD